MTSTDDLAVIRRAYARQILAAAGVNDENIEKAFAAIAREDFLGAGPWPILRSRGYEATPAADPLFLYCDVLVGILPDRSLNNGMPSFHAALLASAGICPGDHVVHVGAGTGYYSAIMAHLAGRHGMVTAIEFDPGLAERAANYLASMNDTAAPVSVVCGDGAAVPFAPADVVYVNAGATRPADNWLDNLKDGGRLILPLTARKMRQTGGNGLPSGPILNGAVFRIERRGEAFLARWVSPVGIFPCEGARDDISEMAIDAALQKGGWQDVTRLYRSDAIADHQCWLKAPGWCLAHE